MLLNMAEYLAYIALGIAVDLGTEADGLFVQVFLKMY